MFQVQRSLHFQYLLFYLICEHIYLFIISSIYSPHSLGKGIENVRIRLLYLLLYPPHIRHVNYRPEIVEPVRKLHDHRLV